MVLSGHEEVGVLNRHPLYRAEPHDGMVTEIKQTAPH